MLKRQIWIAALAVAASWAADSKNTKATARQQQKAAQSSTQKPVTLPKDAVEVSPGVYRHTSADGKVVVYRKTPFGVVVVDDGSGSGSAAAAAQPDSSRLTPFGRSAPASADAAAEPDASRATPFGRSNSAVNLPKAKVDGDTIHFERNTPFGPQRWSKKSNEDMTPDEKSAWDIAREGKAAPDSGRGSGR